MTQKNMKIALTAAISDNNCIGKNGQIPWHIPEDMKRVKELTTGKVIIMGRKTWVSLPEKFKPLPGRTNIVIASDEYCPVPEGVEEYTSIDDALAAHPNEEIFGFGGAGIYAGMIDRADTLYITHVHRTIPDGDAFFPKIDPAIWKETERQDFDGYSFVVYKRLS